MFHSCFAFVLFMFWARQSISHIIFIDERLLAKPRNVSRHSHRRYGRHCHRRTSLFLRDAREFSDTVAVRIKKMAETELYVFLGN